MKHLKTIYRFPANMFTVWIDWNLTRTILNLSVAKWCNCAKTLDILFFGVKGASTHSIAILIKEPECLALLLFWFINSKQNLELHIFRIVLIRILCTAFNLGFFAVNPELIPASKGPNLVDLQLTAICSLTNISARVHLCVTNTCTQQISSQFLNPTVPFLRGMRPAFYYYWAPLLQSLLHFLSSLCHYCRCKYPIHFKFLTCVWKVVKW